MQPGYSNGMITQSTFAMGNIPGTPPPFINQPPIPRPQIGMPVGGISDYLQGPCRYCGSPLPPYVEVNPKWQILFAVLLCLTLTFLMWLPLATNSCMILEWKCPNCDRVRVRDDKLCKKVGPPM